MKKNSKNSKQLLFESMAAINPDFKNEGIDWNAEYSTEQYQDKANKLKTVIDSLVNDEEFEIIDTLYRLLIEKKIRPTGASVAEEIKRMIRNV